MFVSCSSLTGLDLSNFNTSNVTNMSDMFYSCSSLTTLDLSNFDTSNVTNIGGMFRECSSLTSLDISNFDTSNVTSMSYMFYGCSSLNSLDLSNFDTSNVTKIDNMFSECICLSEIIIGPGFSFKGDIFSETYLPDKTWYSAATCKAYTAEEITESRNNIADTYYTDPQKIFGTPDFILPSNLTIIEESSFEGIPATIVYIPDSCTYIGKYAFRNSGIRHIRIPDNCEIEGNAFEDCTHVFIFDKKGSLAEDYGDSHDNCSFVEYTQVLEKGE